MNLDELREQTYCCLNLIAPELGDSSVLVDECLANARKTFSVEFIRQFRPAAWARITLIYHKHFLDSGTDNSIEEIFAEVIRDSLCTKRMDFLTMQLAQIKRHENQHSCACEKDQKPKLTVVRSDPDKDKT